MKVKLKAKYKENERFQVSVEGAPIETYQLGTIQEILHTLIDNTESLGALAHVAEILIHNHPDSKVTGTHLHPEKTTLKISM